VEHLDRLASREVRWSWNWPRQGRGLRKDEEIDAQNRSDDQVSDNVGGDCGPHEKEIRSRMKVLLAGEGLALMEDVFSEDETQ
jgi:hypothetical protein